VFVSVPFFPAWRKLLFDIVLSANLKNYPGKLLQGQKVVLHSLRFGCFGGSFEYLVVQQLQQVRCLPVYLLIILFELALYYFPETTVEN
jgi:hypothetical protein